jgi:Tol biopolymer transport system component
MTRYFLVMLCGIISVLPSCQGNTPTLASIDFRTEQVDILFVSQTEGTVEEIFTVKDAAPNEVWVVNFPSALATLGVSDPSWSKDGRKFAFSSWSHTTVPFNSNIYILNMDSINNSITPVTYSQYGLDTTLGVLVGTVNLRPDWSLNTNKMVFISNHDSVFNVHITNISASLTGDTIFPTRLTDAPASDNINFFCYPSFSPNGTKILYTSAKSGHEEIWEMNANGSAKTQLTHLNASIARRPRYSPTADKISFYSNSVIHGSDSLQIFIMNPNGDSLQQVTTTDNNFDPAWSPDGSQIIFAKQSAPSHSYIYVIDRTGQNERQKISDGRAYYPIWRPKP